MRHTQLENIITPVVTGLGYILWGVEYFPQGNHSILRVFIDSEQGVSLDDCARVSRQLSAVLDVEEPINGRYNLEVSSPGIDRRLYTLEQYQRYIGQKVNLRLRRPIEGRRRFIGVLLEANEETLTLDSDGAKVSIAFADVDKGNLA